MDPKQKKMKERSNKEDKPAKKRKMQNSSQEEDGPTKKIKRHSGKKKRDLEVIENGKIVNDPIWLTIELHPLCVMIIDTPQFQRLRSIKQMGGCFSVFPGACHTRFEHSIGTSYLAGFFGRELQKKTSEVEITDKEILCLEVAGLCHDLGHGPFSHLFDQQFIKKARPDDEWEHEDASLEMIDKIFKSIEQKFINEMEINFIKDLIKNKKNSPATSKKQQEKPFLFEIIANKMNSIDVDKWDYFSRDCHMLGLHHNFQCERSIKQARVLKHDDGYHISFPKSDYQHIFDMFYTRFTLHRRACLHPVVKAVEMMIADAFLEADKSLTFPPNEKDKKKKKCLSESIDDMDAYLWVTDDVLHKIKTLDGERDAKIKKAKHIVDRIERRDLYKMIGEKRVVWGITNGSSEDLKHSMEKKLMGKMIDENLFEIQVVVFSYGNGNENPMKNVKLYRKFRKSRNGKKDVELAVMDEKEISDMFPAKFQQMYIRLYWKGTKNDESNRKKIEDIFSKIKELPLVDAKGKSLKSKVTLVDMK